MEKFTRNAKYKFWKKLYEFLNEHEKEISAQDLLASFLTQYNKGKELFKEANLVIQEDKNKVVTESMKKELHSIEDKTKKQEITDLFLKILNKSQYTREQTQTSLGLETLSNNKWRKINQGIEKKKGGNKPLAGEIKNQILEFLESTTDESILRTKLMRVKKQKRGLVTYSDQVVKIVPCCFSCLHKVVTEKLELNLSYSSFLKILPKNIKKPRKKSPHHPEGKHGLNPFLYPNEDENGKEEIEGEKEIEQIEVDEPSLPPIEFIQRRIEKRKFDDDGISMDNLQKKARTELFYRTE